jgi:hypothetical protein
MQKMEKKVAAALAAVRSYLQEEEDAASYLAVPVLPAENRGVEAGQWAQSGRLDMMSGRRMIQLRAFSNVR